MHAYAHAPAVARTEDSTPPRTRRRLASAAAAALLALAGLFAGASPALAHDELVGYTVEVDSANGSARALTLHFSDEIMDVGTEIVITGPGGEDIADGAPTATGRDVTQPLKTPLPVGDIAIAWRVVSSDGHPISGALTLVAAEDGTATVGPATEAGTVEEEPPAEEHEHGHAETTGETAEDGGSPLVTVLVVAAVAVVAIGAVAAVVVGTGRRRRALDEAVAERTAENGESAAGGEGEEEK